MWAPSPGHNAWNCADRIALSQIPYVFGDWRPVSWPKKRSRGTPCGCPPPLWAPFSGHNAENCADRIALSQIPYVFGDWRPVSWPKNEGRGTPCGCPPPPCGRPSQGIAPRTVQIVVRYRKFSTSLATGGRFLGRKKEGRGTPCGCPPRPCGRPSSAILTSELRCVCPGCLPGSVDIRIRLLTM